MDQSRELTDRFSSGTRHKTVEQFEDAWFRGETPDIDDYLRDDHNHGNVLIEMISIDLECRWRGLSRDSVSESERGDQVDDFPRRPLLEDYVQRFPAIGGLEQLPVVLMADEYRVRQCWGDRPSYDSYSARFPTRTAELNQALRDVDRVLTAESPWVGKQRGSDTGSRSIDLNKSTLLENETPNGERASDGRLRDQSGDGSLAADIGRFGDYVLLEEIARGGMGIVYKAWQPNLDRTVALKMLLAGEFADEDQVRRFQVEAEAAAQLDHPGIVPIYEVGQHKGQHYFTMAYVDGEDLRSVVARGRLQPLEAATIINRVANAVHYAHTRGVIHR
ncbi:MAG: serine/threonine protein kinase, partial [Planctomycetes bacterium]|nr:serine/threonine protein kinase [Planctomycetota bacterium]